VTGCGLSTGCSCMPDFRATFDSLHRLFHECISNPEMDTSSTLCLLYGLKVRIWETGLALNATRSSRIYEVDWFG
jgi:hypothetical protein